MDTKTNTKTMTAKQAKETTRCNGKTLEFMERLREKVQEEIEQKTSNGYLEGEVSISIKSIEVNYIAAIAEIVKELEELGYCAGWTWMVNTITGMRKGAISLYFNWRE
ncbi:hypothetical protein [Oenococcus oeni]|uniref:hypothetical protein n=1 Tax=Oenococcus oeni TaxID=1247 RepID=UPI0008F921FD|nr:hypothetical protein [Oenococcus oeni]OIL84858.1 hypothetical protein ATX39_09460 [Oenococcus oeni]